MNYAALAEVYEKVEATPKRLEMVSLLEVLFRSASPEEARMIAYLTQGRAAPEFVEMEFGVAEKLALKAIAETTRIPEGELLEIYKRTGDMGTVAEHAVANKKQRSLFSTPLTLARVFEDLTRIARAEGGGSQELRMKLIARLLHDASPLESRYLLRTIVGKLRLGVATMSIVDALAQAYAAKEMRDRVEEAYNVCPDLGLVAFTLAKSGIQGLDAITVTPGTPVRVMLAERLSSLQEILEKLGKCALEYKYDGLRIQVHAYDGKVEIFTRQMERVSSQFPDVVSALHGALGTKPIIVEGECVPVDQNTGEMLPFQLVSHRRGRKYRLDEAIQRYPVGVFLFDCLYLDGMGLIQRSYPERRALLAKAVRESPEVRIASSIITDDLERAERFFDEAIAAGCEGVIAKSIAPDARYRAGARGWLWIKYKRDYRSEMVDTVDLVVVGAYAGRGRRAGTYGGLLMAVRDSASGRYQTVTKLGTGFDDAALAELPKILAPYLLSEKDRLVDAEFDADVWFSPSVVMEVLGAEITLSPVHTCAKDRLRRGTGLAIRFPRFTGRYREDKKPEDATTSDEIMEMYKAQLKRLE
ncbi:MAG: ATP-dependent DNA ligase [Candidatus Thermoplasmatota archaeon]